MKARDQDKEENQSNGGAPLLAAPAVCSSLKIVCADIASTFGDKRSDRSDLVPPWGIACEAGRATESWAARDKFGNRPYPTVRGIGQVFLQAFRLEVFIRTSIV